MGRLKLKNRAGEELTVMFRQYRKGDEAEMISCIRDEYEDTYFKRDFYDPDYIKKEAQKGAITFLAAETEGDGIAGMLILKEFYPEESMCEIASMIFRKKYRGYGMAMPFFEYGMGILLSRSYTAAFCLPVLFHDVTQRLLYRLGLRASGMILNVFRMDRVIHSYYNGRNCKHSQGIQVRAVAKRDAGTLYLPSWHRDFCSKIYDSLGVRYRLAEPPEDIGAEAFSEYTDLTYINDDRQKSLEIRIRSPGRDLPGRMEEIHSRYPLKGKQTAGVFLNCNDPGAVRAYGILERMGYFFTGLRPLCGKREYLVMHHPGEVEIFFDDYRATDEFRELIQYVGKAYQNRRGQITK